MKNIKLLPIICGIFFLSLSLLFVKPIAKFSVSENNAAEKIVIIDAGHGGVDGGAVSKSGIVEKGINLGIAKELKNYLETAGYRVIMTREEDISIHDSDAKTIRQQKRSDLNNRLAITQNNPSAVFVSIHQNTINDTVSKGAQVFYSTNNADSERLAKALQESFKSSIQQENKREIKKAGKNLFILYNTKIPAVMTECGFLSNADEAEKLNTKEYQKQVAQTIFNGIENFYKG